MVRRIKLDPKRIQNKQDANVYMKELFQFEDENAAVNTDALTEALSKQTDETDVILTPSVITEICESEYAYSILLALGNASQVNPNLRIRFVKENYEAA